MVAGLLKESEAKKLRKDAEKAEEKARKDAEKAEEKALQKEGAELTKKRGRLPTVLCLCFRHGE